MKFAWTWNHFAYVLIPITGIWYTLVWAILTLRWYSLIIVKRITLQWAEQAGLIRKFLWYRHCLEVQNDEYVTFTIFARKRKPDLQYVVYLEKDTNKYLCLSSQDVYLLTKTLGTELWPVFSSRYCWMGPPSCRSSSLEEEKKIDEQRCYFKPNTSIYSITCALTLGKLSPKRPFTFMQ